MCAVTGSAHRRGKFFAFLAFGWHRVCHGGPFWLAGVLAYWGIETTGAFLFAPVAWDALNPQRKPSLLAWGKRLRTTLAEQWRYAALVLILTSCVIGLPWASMKARASCWGNPNPWNIGTRDHLGLASRTPAVHCPLGSPFSLRESRAAERRQTDGRLAIHLIAPGPALTWASGLQRPIFGSPSWGLSARRASAAPVVCGRGRSRARSGRQAC